MHLIVHLIVQVVIVEVQRCEGAKVKGERCKGAEVQKYSRSAGVLSRC